VGKSKSKHRVRTEGYRAISSVLVAWKGSVGGFGRQLDEDGVQYLSFSKLSELESCQYRYFLRYVEGVKVKEPDYFVKGRVFHEAASLAYRQLAQAKVNLRPIERLANRHFDEESAGHIVNAVQLLIENAHRDHEVVATELPFVLSLAQGMPPLVGVIDLLLRSGDTLVVVDHKSGKGFYERDHFQLHLYQEHVRRAFKPKLCLAFFDEYRWVNNLSRIRKPAFRRTPVPSKPWPTVLARVQKGWKTMQQIKRTGKARADGECVSCPLKEKCPKAAVGYEWW
jgi:predicted RecB family nuclease